MPLGQRFHIRPQGAKQREQPAHGARARAAMDWSGMKVARAPLVMQAAAIRTPMSELPHTAVPAHTHAHAHCTRTDTRARTRTHAQAPSRTRTHARTVGGRKTHRLKGSELSPGRKPALITAMSCTPMRSTSSVSLFKHFKCLSLHLTLNRQCVPYNPCPLFTLRSKPVREATSVSRITLHPKPQ